MNPGIKVCRQPYPSKLARKEMRLASRISVHRPKALPDCPVFQYFETKEMYRETKLTEAEVRIQELYSATQMVCRKLLVKEECTIEIKTPYAVEVIKECWQRIDALGESLGKRFRMHYEPGLLVIKRTV